VGVMLSCNISKEELRVTNISHLASSQPYDLSPDFSYSIHPRYNSALFIFLRACLYGLQVNQGYRNSMSGPSMDKGGLLCMSGT